MIIGTLLVVIILILLMGSENFLEAAGALIKWIFIILFWIVVAVLVIAAMK